MNKLVIFNKSNLKKSLRKREGETKFGEQVHVLSNSENIYEQLRGLDVDYVIFGIPEDIGVSANSEKTGTSSAWQATLKVLLNIEANVYLNAKRVVILGHLDFSEEQNILSSLSDSKSGYLKKARQLVTTIDKQVTQLVHDIIKAGKTPIIIGGGRNNAYGNIKGASLALKRKINSVNLTTTSGLDKEEGRHAGNGFKYALSEGFLGSYFILGMHQNYINQQHLDLIKTNKSKIDYNTFEDLTVTKRLKFDKECKRALNMVSHSAFGIEIDCNAIENIASSAITPSGFSANKTRRFLHTFAAQKHVKYLHICNAAPARVPKKLSSKTAKLITYLITDFIKAK